MPPQKLAGRKYLKREERRPANDISAILRDKTISACPLGVPSDECITAFKALLDIARDIFKRDYPAFIDTDIKRLKECVKILQLAR